nr:HIT domain-containing protein [Streptococcus ovuberis]
MLETEHCYLIFDIDPIQARHLLIITKALLVNLTDLSNQAALELLQVQKQFISALYNLYPNYDWTFACNNGQLMDPGTHPHVHAILDNQVMVSGKPFRQKL